MSDYVYGKDPNKVGPITAITIIFLMAALVGTIVYFLLIKIRPPSPITQFGLMPGKQGTVLYLCGSSSTEACIFPITNLTDAVNICKKYLNVCTAFSIDNTNYVKFIVPQDFTDNANSNVYIYQYNVEQKKN